MPRRGSWVQIPSSAPIIRHKLPHDICHGVLFLPKGHTKGHSIKWFWVLINDRLPFYRGISIVLRYAENIAWGFRKDMARKRNGVFSTRDLAFLIGNQHMGKRSGFPYRDGSVLYESYYYLVRIIIALPQGIFVEYHEIEGPSKGNCPCHGESYRETVTNPPQP